MRKGKPSRQAAHTTSERSSTAIFRLHPMRLPREPLQMRVIGAAPISNCSLHLATGGVGGRRGRITLPSLGSSAVVVCTEAPCPHQHDACGIQTLPLPRPPPPRTSEHEKWAFDKCAFYHSFALPSESPIKQCPKGVPAKPVVPGQPIAIQPR